MPVPQNIRTLCAAILLVGLAAAPLMAQDTPDGLLEEARTLYQGAETPVDDLRAIRALLDRIVLEHPASDQAVQILLAEPVGGLDIAAIDAGLAAASPPAPRDTGRATGVTGEAAPSDRAALLPTFPQPAAPPSAVTQQAIPDLPAVRPGPGTAETETALNLDRQAIREVQARLLVLGFDPNGIDGRIGPGTRGALRGWQASRGIEATGFLNAAQRDDMARQSQPALTTWLQEPDNALLMTPPPPIAVGPGNLPGTWRFTSNCGPNSRLGRIRITGALTVRHAGGNRYSGSARQSQGFNGRFSGQLSGRTLNGEINWGLLVGRTQFSGRIEDQRLALFGRDSNRCRFSAVKSR